MTPLFDPVTLATPLVKLIAVAVPKLVAVPELFVTVGCVPLGASAAPPKVRLWEPVYPVAVLPFASLAVTVRLSATAAIGVVLAALSESWVATPMLTVTLVDELVAVQVLQLTVIV